MNKKNRNNLLLSLLVSSAMGSMFTNNIDALEKKQELDSNVKADELIKDINQNQVNENINIKMNSIDIFKIEDNNKDNTNTKEKTNIYSTIKFGKNKSLKITAFFEAMTQENIDLIQKTLNKGNTIAVYNKLDNNDNKLTYIAGHNPGTMTQFTKFVKENREIQVYDINGNKQTYILHFLCTQDFAKSGSTTMKQEVVNYVINKDKEKRIIFQFCRNNKAEMWTAVPKINN